MTGILIIANAANRVKVFTPIADKLSEMGMKVSFISLDSVQDGKASEVLRKSRHPFIEFPFTTEVKLFDMSRNDRFRTLQLIRIQVMELLDTIKPDVILLGAAAYVEGVIIEEARKRNIKTALMQDGLRNDAGSGSKAKIRAFLLRYSRSLVNEWTLPLTGVNYFFTPFETNRVDKIMLFGNDQLNRLRKSGVHKERLVAVGSPVYDNLISIPNERASEIRSFFSFQPNSQVLLFGMQCFFKHSILPLDEEIKIVEDLINLFRKLKHVNLVIKLHPDNDYNIYQSRFKEGKISDNVHLVKDEFTPSELLSISSAFATVFSTMALEAIVRFIPVISLEYTRVATKLNLEPAAIPVKSINELEILLEKENWVEELQMQLRKNRDQILDRELVNLGFASERAAQELIRLSKPS
jgi:UDP-N-acetylglucosamine 2-epimerase